MTSSQDCLVFFVVLLGAFSPFLDGAFETGFVAL
jgi:hypothetical protein